MKTYEIKSFPRTVKDIYSMNKNGKLSFDNAAQRGLKWENKVKNNQKSLLIDTIIRGIPRVPPMYANCLFTDPKNKIYDFADGKQRCNTLIEFLDDGFELIGLPLFNLDENAEEDEDSENLIDINGKKFSGLPEEFQDIIKNYSLTVYYYENLSQDEVDEIIRRLNNGKAFTAAEKLRLNTKSIDIIKNIAKHEIFETALTEKAINGFTNEKIVMQSYIILNESNPSFETVDINTIMETTDITTEQAQDIKTAYQRILDVYNDIKTIQGDADVIKKANRVAKRIFTRTHLVSLVPLALRSVNEKVTVKGFSVWVQSFFSGKKSASISVEYNNAVGSGSAKPEAIRQRLEAITNDYKNHFKQVQEV